MLRHFSTPTRRLLPPLSPALSLFGRPYSTSPLSLKSPPTFPQPTESLKGWQGKGAIPSRAEQLAALKLASKEQKK